MQGPEKAIGRKVKCASCNHLFLFQPSNVSHAAAQPAKQAESVAAARGKPKPDKPKPDKPIRAESTDGFRIPPEVKQRAIKLAPIHSTPSIFGVIGAGITLSAYWFSFAAVSCFVVFHLIWNFPMLTGDRGSMLIMIPVFILILLVSVGILIVMLKPIRALRTRNVARSIKSSSEPALFNLINEVADSVGAARPSRIEVDYEFRTNVEPLDSFADVSGENLYLRLGLPVLANNSTEHFTTLLATKLGLYSKHHNNKSMIFVRNIVDWLWRSAYLPDAWDAIPQRMMESNKFETVNKPAAQFLKFCFILIVRLPFRLLHGIATILCRSDLKKQELNADALSAAIHGPETFREFLVEHQNLGLAQKSALNDFVDSIEAKYAVPDVFDVISLKRKYLNEFQLEDVQKEIEAGNSFSFESLNSDSERIKTLEAINGEPSDWFSSNEPIKNLVQCYPLLATRCTDDLRNYLQQQMTGKAGARKSAKTRRQRAVEIDRYIKSALRDGIKSAE